MYGSDFFGRDDDDFPNTSQLDLPTDLSYIPSSSDDINIFSENSQCAETLAQNLGRGTAGLLGATDNGFHIDDVNGHGTWVAGIAAGKNSESSENRGVASGAKIAVFDGSYDGDALYHHWAGTLGFDLGSEAGARIHSNSWGIFSFCTSTTLDNIYDTFVHDVRQNERRFIG